MSQVVSAAVCITNSDFSFLASENNEIGFSNDVEGEEGDDE